MIRLDRTEYELLIYASDSPGEPRRISAVTADFSLQAIPQATVRLPVGTVMGGRNAVADNTLPKDWLKVNRKLRVAMRKKAYSLVTRKAFTTEEVLFEGYVSQPSVSIQAQQGEVILGLTHWLRDLFNSSTMHEYATLVRASQQKFDSIHYDSHDAGLKSGLAILPEAYGLPANWEQELGQDIWAKGQKPVLARLATYPLRDIFLNTTDCGKAVNTVSSLAGEALKRIQGPTKLLGSPYKDGGVPLQVRLQGRLLEDQLVTRACARVIGYQPLQNFRGSTFWDQVMIFCQNFAAMLVPRPLDAMICPIHSMESPYSVQILEGELLGVEWADIRQVELRGIIVIGREIESIGLDRTVKKDASQPKLNNYGCFTYSDDPNLGRIIPVDAPEWLSALSSAGDTGGFVAGNRGRHHDPLQGTPAGAPQGALVGELFNDYGRMRYFEEALRDRTASVATALRTDISPGSTVVVAARTDRVGSVIGEDQVVLVGLVTRVSIHVDRLAGRAMSTFDLRFVRTLREISEGVYPVIPHPLFETRFSGAKLVSS